MREPRVWVIKCRETLVDGSDGWHWREYLPLEGLVVDDEPVEDWGGSDWIRSPYSKKLLRDEVISGDIGVCYQTDDPDAGRSILGFTRFVSDGKEEYTGSGDFNCFDLCPPSECFVLSPPLRINDLYATGCRPSAFGRGTQGTIFPVASDELQGVLKAVDVYTPELGVRLRNWVRAATGGKVSFGDEEATGGRSGSRRDTLRQARSELSSKPVGDSGQERDSTADVSDQTVISGTSDVRVHRVVDADSLSKRLPPKDATQRRDPETPSATKAVFHRRVNIGFVPHEPFRKLLVAVYSASRVRWTRRRVLAAFGYQKMGSTVAATIANALSERGIRLLTDLLQVGPDGAVWLERGDAHFASASLAEKLKNELTLLAAGRARIRFQDLLLFCGIVRDGPKARESVKAVLHAGNIAVTPVLKNVRQRDWVYVSIPVEVPPPLPPPSPPSTVSHREASRLADKQLAKKSVAEDQPLQWRSKQKELTERFIEGRNTFGVLPCGTGKSLCFQITTEALKSQGLTLVVSPLIALITDMAKHPLAGVTALNSSVSEEDRESRLRYLSEGRYHLLYLTPEQLGSNRLLWLLTRLERRVIRVAIDEAHCVSEWGQSFRVEYLLLLDVLIRLGSPPVLLLTATAPPEVRRDVVTRLGVEFNLHQGKDLILDYWRKDELVPGVTRVRGNPKKYRALRGFVAEQGPDTRGIVYTRFATAGDDDDRENVHEIGAWLEANGFGPVALYHGQLDSATKQEEQRRFTSGEARIAVATNAFGLGIDLPDIDWIVHFYMPPSLLDYYQEIGRGAHGTDGRRCRCLVLYDPDDRKLVEGLVLGNIASARKIATRFRQLVESKGSQHGLRGTYEVLYDPARKVLLLPFRPMKKQYTARIAHMLALESIGVLKHLPHSLFRGDNVYAQFQLHRESLTTDDMDALAERQLSRREQVVSRLDAMQRFCETRDDDERWSILDEHFGS